MPRVSVLMPMRNAGPFVGRALGSVLSQGVDLEVVVVDDGSTDDSRRAVGRAGDARVRVVDGPCLGISAAMNAAVGAARGDYLARCDADDVYPAGRLDWQLAWLDARPEFGAVCGPFSTFTRDDRPIAPLDSGATAEEVTGELRAGRTRTHFCTFTVRAEAVRRAGGFRPFFVTAEDVDMMLRLGETCRVWYEPRPSYAYRLHAGSVTHRQDESQRVFYEEAARRFQAQRLTTGLDDLARGDPPRPPAAAVARPSRLAAQVQGQLLGHAWGERRAGRWRSAVGQGLRACLADPRNVGAWRSFAALLVKP